MENETEEESDMPIRVMGYDYSAYRAQIDKGNARYPVITIVLNFSDKKWNKPVHLKDILEIPEGMEKFVKDYEITVFNIAFLPDETIASFKSTFKHVAHFFKNKRLLDNYHPLDEEIEHLEAFLDLLKVFTGDKKYEEIKYSLIERQRKGEVVTMCTVVEKFTNDGIQQGIQQGIKQGIEQGEKQIILNMHNRGCDAETIFNLTGISLDIVKNILENAI